MRRVFAQRASTVLYRLLLGRQDDRPWLLPANICPIVPLVFLKAGVPMEWIDIDADSLCLDLRELLHRVDAHPTRYGGALFVHTYGRAQRLDGVIDSLHQIAPDLTFVDDRCVCWPEFEPINEQANVTLFSTGYAKPVDIGFGGYAFLRETVGYDDSDDAYDPKALESLTEQYKQRIAAGRPIRNADGDWLDHSTPTLDFDGYQTKVIEATSAARHHQAALREIYAAIPASVRLPDGDWRTHLRLPERDAFVEKMFRSDLFCGTHYAPVSKIFGHADAPNAERLHQDVVNLFDDRYYTQEQAQRTVRLIEEHLNSCR